MAQFFEKKIFPGCPYPVDYRLQGTSRIAALQASDHLNNGM
ncbi:hypothetical protein [Alteromonas halophila]|nr:hypothetical protein [Alteromonas halophila]